MRLHADAESEDLEFAALLRNNTLLTLTYVSGSPKPAPQASRLANR